MGRVDADARRKVMARILSLFTESDGLSLAIWTCAENQVEESRCDRLRVKGWYLRIDSGQDWNSDHLVEISRTPGYSFRGSE